MVREFGLSPALGPVGYATASGEPFDDGPLARRPYSQATQRAVDRETGRLLREAEARALHLLNTHRAALDDLCARPLDSESPTGDEVGDALRATPLEAHPERAADDRT
jgi:cell division protease FtsH